MPVQTGDTHTFKHAWGDISLASWKKYPSAQREDVVQLDLLERRFDAETGVLETTRLCQARAGTPAWFNMIFGTPQYVYFVEQATIDPRANRMTLVSRNVTWAALLSMTETCVYLPNRGRAGWTDLSQCATVRSTTWGVAHRIEEYCASRYRTNANLGRAVMEDAITRIKREASDGLVLVEDMRQKIRDGFKEGLDKVDDLGDALGAAVSIDAPAARAADRKKDDEDDASAVLTPAAMRAQANESLISAALAARGAGASSSTGRPRS